MVTGHNERIAWGVTNLEFDVQDLYREQIDLGSGRYLFQGRQEQARLERDVIAVKGAPPVSLAMWVTRHGPVFVSDAGRQYAIRWTAAEPGGITFPFVDVDRARNWSEFVAALGRYARSGAEFRVRGCRRQYRVSRHGPSPASPEVRGRCPVGGPFGRLRMGRLPSFRSIAAGIQSPVGHHCDREPESFSRCRRRCRQECVPVF